MYCGSTQDLSREHIVPYGLGGPSAVPRSSCRSCAEVTSKFELEVLRGPLWGLRAYLRLSSRRTHMMPVCLPLVLVRDGREEEVRIPIAEHPIMLSFPIFAIPGHVSGKTTEGISIRGIATYNFGKPIPQVLAEHSANDFRVRENSRPVSFARLVAKIAWGVAVVNGQRARLDDELRNAILFQPSRIGQWVGTYSDPLDASAPDLLHEIRLREDRDTGLFLADVQLFAHVCTPRYGVILGKL